MATTEYSNQSRELTDPLAKIPGFVRSQIILFSSRKKNALVYTLATVVGIFCMPGGIAQFASSADALLVAQKVLPLPFMTIMMAVGLYVFNDLSDVSVDRANGKKRPIPMGLVTKGQTVAFVIGTNSIAAILAIVTANLLTMLMIVPMIALGLLYSAPKIALKDRFVIKTLTIAGLMASCVFLGTTAGSFLTSTDLALPEFAALMVGMMIFVTSPFNDLGDLKGDLAAGRKTIPIVLGTNRTLGMMGVISSSMSAISWVSYFYSAIGISGPLLITAMNSIVLLIILRTREKSDAKSLRNLHSKLVPLHFLLHLGLILGAVFA